MNERSRTKLAFEQRCSSCNTTIAVLGHSGWNLTHPGADHLDSIPKIYSKLPGADYRVKVKESRVETETLGYYNVIGYVYRTAEVGKGRVANARKETKRMSAERSISYTMGGHYRSREFSYGKQSQYIYLVRPCQ